MYWPSEVTFHCDVCGFEQKYNNPGQYGISTVAWKALANGWSLSTAGKHLCPTCKVKLANKAGVPVEWFEANGKIKATIDEVNNLPQGPAPVG